MDKFAVFEKMTKGQIIDWIKSNTWMHSDYLLPKESDLLWNKYEELSSKAIREGELHLEEGRRLQETNWTERYNQLAAECNKSTDIQENIEIIDQMQKLRDPWDKHIEDYKRIDQIHEEAEKVLEKYNKAKAKRKEEEGED